MDIILILILEAMLLCLLILHRGKSKPKKTPVRHIKHRPQGVEETPDRIRSRESVQAVPSTQADIRSEALVSIGGWKPMSRADVEIETLWRLEHVLREIPDMAQSPVVMIDYSMEPRELAIALASNPFYAAKILKTVNSAAFGLRHRIDSLQRAITFLGYNQVKNIVFEHVIGEHLSKLESVADKYLESVKLWQHSHAVSVCADYILQEVLKNTRGSGIITTAALLHDIGWVVYNQYDTESAQRLFQRLQEAGKEDNPVELEEDEFGFNHLILGKMLAKQWQIPDQICEYIGRHHCTTFGVEEGLEREVIFGALVISKAEALAAELGYPNPLPEPLKQNLDLAQVLGLPVGRRIEGSLKLREELEKTIKFIAEFQQH